APPRPYPLALHDALPISRFEVGKDRVGAGGVVRDLELRADAVRGAAAAAQELGLTVRGVTYSPLPGPSGNVEYLLWLGKGEGEPDRKSTRLNSSHVKSSY